MRRSFKWGLAITVVLSALALWNPPSPNLVPAAIRPDRGTGVASVSPAPGTSGRYALHANLAALGPLPTEWPPQTLEPAKRDFFLPSDAAVPQVVAPPAPPEAMTEPAAPTAPPMAYRYWGQMTTPEGARLFYLTLGDAPIAIAPGQVLPDGYVVESVSTEGIELIYPALGHKARVAIPPASP